MQMWTLNKYYSTQLSRSKRKETQPKCKASELIHPPEKIGEVFEQQRMLMRMTRFPLWFSSSRGTNCGRGSRDRHSFVQQR